MVTATAGQECQTVGTAEMLATIRALPDPEIPVLTLGDLGIIRSLERSQSGVVVAVTPTYSACPATEFIEASICRALKQLGEKKVSIERILSPAWTTDWISDEGRRKLIEYGIAPPATAATSKHVLSGNDRPAACPRCESTETERISEFGSTPCKATYRCQSCREPFEYFKCL